MSVECIFVPFHKSNNGIQRECESKQKNTKKSKWTRVVCSYLCTNQQVVFPLRSRNISTMMKVCRFIVVSQVSNIYGESLQSLSHIYFSYAYIHIWRLDVVALLLVKYLQSIITFFAHLPCRPRTLRRYCYFYYLLYSLGHDAVC